MKFVERNHMDYLLEIRVKGASALFKCDKHWNPIFSCPEEETLYGELMSSPHELKTTVSTFPLPPIGICECGYEEYHEMWTYYAGCPKCGRRYACNGEPLEP